MTSLDLVRDELVREFDLPAERVVADATLESLGIDSLSLFELLFKIEESSNIRFPDERGPITTVGDLAREVDRVIALGGPIGAAQPG